MTTNQLTYVADVKVGKVKGNSRVYPQLRLPSQYAELAGKRASMYEINRPEEDTAFLIRFDDFENKGVAAYHERAERAGASFACDEPCRGSDSGSNLDSGALFLLSTLEQLVLCKISDLSSLICNSRVERRLSTKLTDSMGLNLSTDLFTFTTKTSSPSCSVS